MQELRHKTTTMGDTENRRMSEHEARMRAKFSHAGVAEIEREAKQTLDMQTQLPKQRPRTEYSSSGK